MHITSENTRLRGPWNKKKLRDPWFLKNQPENVVSKPQPGTYTASLEDNFLQDMNFEANNKLHKYKQIKDNLYQRNQIRWWAMDEENPKE